MRTRVLAGLRLATALLLSAAGLTVATPAVAVGEITIVPVVLASARVGVDPPAALSAAGGTAPYAYTVISGALPAGVTLSPSGTFDGKPTASGTFNFVVFVEDVNRTPATHSYSWTVLPPTMTVVPSGLNSAQLDIPFSAQFSAVGGTAPYVFAITAGTLPPGLTFGSNGVISGTPTAPGAFSLMVRTTDSTTGTGPWSITDTYSIWVTNPALSLAPSVLPDPIAGVPYSATLVASGGIAPYTYSITAGSLPEGLTLHPATGVISGTPSTRGWGPFTVVAWDSTSTPRESTRNYVFQRPTPVFQVTPSEVPDGIVGQPYEVTIVGAGGTDPYAYSLAAGSSLPPGLALDAASGLLSGTPTVAGDYSFDVRIDDDTPGLVEYFTTVTYTLSVRDVVIPPALVLETVSLPAAQAGQPYSAAVHAVGGVAPYTFSATGLPTGLTVSEAGVISGTPQASGTFNVVAKVADANDDLATRTLSLLIYSNQLTVPSSVTAGDPLTVTGEGWQPGTYEVLLHSDPVVLGSVTVGANGVLSFGAPVPTSVLAGNHTVQVERGGVVVASVRFTVTAAPAAPVPTTPTTPTTPVPTTPGPAAPAPAPVAPVLAATGWNANELLRVAVMLFAASGVALALSARRRTRADLR